MSDQISVLDAMPSAADFYGRYWNQQPFVVRGAVSEGDMAGLISADELAGLSMEEAAQSRLIKTASGHQNWSCRTGPFSEQDFNTAGDSDWSLLVQNVEQFHPDTAQLLRYFSFAPRWLMDDIMVSYSTRGGSVGPHLDSYHVFLVQGQGRRRWKVGRQAIRDEVFIEGLDLKVLEGEFEGDEIEVTCGDLLYLPPRFGHQGVTLEDALTFSVGFLGPKLSELFIGYGQYLSGSEDLDQRYVGDELDADSAGFSIDNAAVDNLRDRFSRQLNTMDFNQWLVEFFTESSHDDFGTYSLREDALDDDQFRSELEKGTGLVKPEYVKFALTASSTGKFCLGFDRQSFVIAERLRPMIQKLMDEEIVDLKTLHQMFDHADCFGLLLELYNHQALEFSAPEPFE